LSCNSVDKVLKAKSSQYLTDYHLWLSSLVKPSYSRFTRSQRLTCSTCLLMTHMALAVLWFHYFTDEVWNVFFLYLFEVFLCYCTVLGRAGWKSHMLRLVSLWWTAASAKIFNTRSIKMW